MLIKTMRYFKNWKSFIFIVLVGCGFSFAACNITSSNSTPYYHFSKTAQDYCLFSKGTNWTYKNDQTGTTYKISINKLNSYVGFHVKNPLTNAYSYDAVEMQYDSNGLQLSKALITAGPTLAGNTEANDLYRIFWNDSSFILAFAPGYTMGEEQRLGGEEGLYTNLEVLSTFSVNNKEFSNVYHTQVIKAENNADSARYEFYFAPHNGLIKWMKVYKGVTISYSLQSDSIVQQ